MSPAPTTEAVSAVASFVAQEVEGPRAVLFYGGPLARRVAIQPRKATESLFVALEQVPRDSNRVARDTTGAVSVAIFWTALPLGLPGDPASATTLRAEVADQRGHLYPATRTHPALLVLDAAAPTRFPRVTWRVTPVAARLLSGRGIPARLLMP